MRGQPITTTPLGPGAGRSAAIGRESRDAMGETFDSALRHFSERVSESKISVKTHTSPSPCRH